MEYFKMGYGLTTQADPITENCNLFLATYHILKHLKSGLSKEDRDFFIQNMELKVNQFGLYNRRSIEGNPVRSVSQDEILGWMISSDLLVTSHGADIWSHLIRHLGSYNNTGRWLDYLTFNPGNFYSWGQIVGSPLSYIFLPIYVINLLIAISKEPANTSSKIMLWMELETMPKTKINSILSSVFEHRMIAQYGADFVSVLLHKYHNRESEEFPIFKEL